MSRKTSAREPAAHVTAAVLCIAQGRKKEGSADDNDKACGPHGGHLICGDYTAETAGVVSTRIDGQWAVATSNEAKRQELIGQIVGYNREDLEVMWAVFQ